jgi:tetratricopeptide (TPR) repeat protein
MVNVWGSIWLTSWALPAPLNVDLAAVIGPSHLSTGVTALEASTSSPSILSEGVSSWILAAAPSKDEVQLLRQAFAEFYGVDRDLARSEGLFSEVIGLWLKQPADERAALYRVRGDCYALLADADKAIADYATAIQLLQSPGGDKADPEELPAALLGRARAYKSRGTDLAKADAVQASKDYEAYLKLASREEWDTDVELVEDGATRNPYAAWEWGSVLRQTGDWEAAGRAHALAAQAFTEIGDRAHAVMSLTDAGIDYAAANNVAEATSILEKAIRQTQGVEARDTVLLQKVIAKEGEGRMALAALLWNDSKEPNGKFQAEKILGDACVRLEQMQAQKSGKTSSTTALAPMSTGLRFSIDDTTPAAMDISCYRFKNPAFLDKLGWPADLQKKVIKLETLR